MDRTVRVIIVDDKRLARQALGALLRRPGIEVVGELDSADALESTVSLLRPDVVLMDVRMPRLDGIEAARRLKAAWPDVRVVILTMHGYYRTTAMAAGADEFLIKGCETEDLINAVCGIQAVAP